MSGDDPLASSQATGPDDNLDPETAPGLPATTLAQQAVSTAEPERSDLARRLRLHTSAVPEILRLSWPVMLATGAVTLAGVIDRAMIGRLGDAEGGAAVPLAAVGIATQFFFLVQSSLFAIGLACVALMARAIGAREPREAQRAFGASLQVGVAISIALSVPIALVAPAAFAFLGQEQNVTEAAVPYLNYVLASSVLMAAALVIESGLRADKHMRFPMLVAMVVMGFKLLLNWILIFGHFGAPRLELVGAGIATLISQAVGLAVLVARVVVEPNSTPLGVRARDVFGINPRSREVVRIALPGIAERLVMNTAMLSYIWVLGHYYGTLSVAAYTVGIPLLAFTWIPGQSYAQACATLIGQALGAREPDEAERIGWQSAGLAIATAVLLGAFVGVFRFDIAGLLTDDMAVIAALGPFMLALAIAQPLLQLQFVLGGAHRGAGDTGTPLLAACVGNWLFRVPLAFLFAIVLGYGVAWVWSALIFDHLARSLVLLYTFRRGDWKTELDD
ncbi:MAG: MATE family efflux transporter [Myxococcota bacterium]|jgi:putative MATE family efflux protein|nr:MATE family efflux transporter [Myxococcota bacterium]